MDPIELTLARAVIAAAGLALTAIFFASYTLLSDRAGATFGPVGAVARGFAVAAVFWIAVQVIRGWPAALVAPANLPKVLFVGIGGTLVPFLLFIWAIQHVGPERGAIVATLEPVLAAAIAWLWLDQALLPVQIVGGLLVIAAVVVLQLRAPKSLAPPPSA